MDPTFNLHFRSHHTSDEYPSRAFCFPFAYTKVTLRDPHIGRDVDVFYARTSCHSALSTAQNRNQIMPQISHQKLPAQMLEDLMTYPNTVSCISQGCPHRRQFPVSVSSVTQPSGQHIRKPTAFTHHP